MSKTRTERFPVEIRGDKLFVEDIEVVLPWTLGVVNGRLQRDYSDSGRRYDFLPGHTDNLDVGFTDRHNRLVLNMCECNSLFVAYYRASNCPHCRDLADIRVKERTQQANIKRAARRRDKRADAKCAVCGEPLVERRRDAGARPGYCSTVCKQKAYRARIRQEHRHDEAIDATAKPSTCASLFDPPSAAT